LKKALFICNQNQHRSKTAEYLFKDLFETKSAGLFNEKPVCKSDISWADIVFVMEEHQRIEISKRFPCIYLQKRILNMEVPDIFRRDQPELVELLKKSMLDLF
jgi:predicted protein tyrosine phosphatase